jgi:hypothetical protein
LRVLVDGSELRADFFVERDGDRLAVILESFSGGDSSRPARNPDYRRTLRVLLGRLQGLNATLTGAFVDSRDTQRAGIPEAERRLIQGEIPLGTEPDTGRIYTLLSNNQRRVALSPKATGPSNATRRIRLRLAVPGYAPEEHGRLERDLGSQPGSYRSADEPDPGQTYSEGTLTRVEVNKYERDPRARQECLDRYGHRCQACGVDFGERYGALGEGFIHVHHIRELSTVGPGYTVDPAVDLRPLCPNCHAMVHRVSPAMPVEDLRDLLSARR